MQVVTLISRPQEMDTSFDLKCACLVLVHPLVAWEHGVVFLTGSDDLRSRTGSLLCCCARDAVW